MIETPVLIAGGGPIGLALAADLGRRGVPAMLVEARENKLASPKMLEVGMRTMEFCRQLGIAKDVRNWGFPFDWPLDSVFVTALTGYELGRVRSPSLAEQSSNGHSPERSMCCPQTWFDPILQRHARSFPHITLRYQTKLESFVQDPDGVTATLTDQRDGKTETVRCQYLVGCDGFASTVRALLGIEVRGEPHIDWSMTVYLRIQNLSQYHDKGNAMRYVFVGPNGTWSFLSTIDGKDYWRQQLIGLDREKLEQTDIAEVMRRAFGRDIPYTVDDTTMWVRKMTVADRFADGRVFLAGDSAHAHPPNGGLGMNTGIQDSFDLGWKLAAMVQGWGGPNLMESYDIERRPASARANLVSLGSFRRLNAAPPNPAIDQPTPEGEAVRRVVGRKLVEENQKSWHPFGVHLGYIYDPSPIVVPDGTTRPPEDTFGYEPSAYPGARAPHIWLTNNRSTLDLYGPGFTLLSFDGVAPDGIAQAAAHRGVPFTVQPLEHRDAAELYAGRLVLVRPDGHVAWRADDAPRDPMALIDTVRGAGPRIAARRATG
jgi:2-polyprenyl-6-methoxyphenol hydroxylase-like FAD-dependent oxidoreductase